MKIAIISDTHDNLPNISKAISWMKNNGVEKLIHCGDISMPETLAEIKKQFEGEFLFVFGNMDDGKFPADDEHFKDFEEIQASGKKIAFTHFPEIARNLAMSGKYNLVFYGHTHKPWEENIGNARVINPGNISGTFYKATFAVYDTETDKLELKILEKINV